MTEGRKSYGPPIRRIREREDYVSPQRLYRTTTYGGTVTDTYSNTNTLAVGEYQITKDFVTRGYRSRIARGEIVQHPFSSKKVKVSHNYTGFKYRRVGTGSSGVTQYFESPHWYTYPRSIAWNGRPSSVPYSSIKTEAVTQAMSKVNSSDIEGIVEVAEGRKILDTFRVRTDSLNRHLNYQLRRSKTLTEAAIRALGGIANVMSSNWLRYRYGIMPLLYLMDDALSGDNPIPLRKTERGYASWSYSESNERVDSGNYYRDTWTEDDNYTISAHAGVLYRPDWTRSRYGVSLRDLPSAAWELVTLSFVLDWFANVGPAIKATSMSIGLKELARWVTVKESYVRSNTVNSEWIYTGSTYSNVSSVTGGNIVDMEITNRFLRPKCGLVFRRGSIQKMVAGGDKRVIDSFALSNVLLQKLLRSKP